MNSFRVLTIAGSDSSGGAGIQADLKTIMSLGCYGASAITALTAQNTIGVQGVHSCPPNFIEQQIRSVLQDIDINSIKTGMLYDSDTIQVVVRALKAHYGGTPPPVVCDPVCVSTSGHTLLQPQAVKTLIRDLFPLVTVVTPNQPEAELLLSQAESVTKINSLQDMIFASSELLKYGCRAVLLKGGHITVTMSDISQVASRFPNATILCQGWPQENVEILRINRILSPDDKLVADVLAQSNGEVAIFVHPRIESRNTHGTGCTLSSALACGLARNLNLVEATQAAVMYVHLGIMTAPTLGTGNGPLNHLHSTQIVSLSKPNRFNPYPLTSYLVEHTAGSWKAFVEHDFVRLLGMGTLDRKSFIHFIKQDYHYLRYYSRAYGYLAAKNTNFSAIEASAKVVISIAEETQNHIRMCEDFGVTTDELESTPESALTTAYGAYILDMGLQGDTMKLIMALSACLLGYGEVGLWLKNEASRANSWVVLDGNPYKQWIDIYSGLHYQEAVKEGLKAIESHAAADPPSDGRRQEWLAIWRRCTVLEKKFWDMAMNISW